MNVTQARLKILRLMRDHGPVNASGVSDALGWTPSRAINALTRGSGYFWDPFPLAKTTYKARLEGLEALARVSPPSEGTEDTGES